MSHSNDDIEIQETTVQRTPQTLHSPPAKLLVFPNCITHTGSCDLTDIKRADFGWNSRRSQLLISMHSSRGALIPVDTKGPRSEYCYRMRVNVGKYTKHCAMNMSFDQEAGKITQLRWAVAGSVYTARPVVNGLPGAFHLDTEQTEVPWSVKVIPPSDVPGYSDPTATQLLWIKRWWCGFEVMTVLVTLCDSVSDILVIQEYFRSGLTGWAILSVVLILVSNIVMACALCMTNIKTSCWKSSLWFVWFIVVGQFIPALHWIKSQTGPKEKIQLRLPGKWINRVLQHMFFILETLGESIPQSIVQVLVVIIHSDKITSLQIFSLCLSLLSMCSKAFHATPSPDKIISLGCQALVCGDLFVLFFTYLSLFALPTTTTTDYSIWFPGVVIHDVSIWVYLWYWKAVLTNLLGHILWVLLVKRFAKSLLRSYSTVAPAIVVVMLLGPLIVTIAGLLVEGIKFSFVILLFMWMGLAAEIDASDIGLELVRFLTAKSLLLKVVCGRRKQQYEHKLRFLNAFHYDTVCDRQSAVRNWPPCRICEKETSETFLYKHEQPQPQHTPVTFDNYPTVYSIRSADTKNLYCLECLHLYFQELKTKASIQNAQGYVLPHAHHLHIFNFVMSHLFRFHPDPWEIRQLLQHNAPTNNPDVGYIYTRFPLLRYWQQQGYWRRAAISLQDSNHLGYTIPVLFGSILILNVYSVVLPILLAIHLDHWTPLHYLTGIGGLVCTIVGLFVVTLRFLCYVGLFQDTFMYSHWRSWLTTFTPVQAIDAYYSKTTVITVVPCLLDHKYKRLPMDVIGVILAFCGSSDVVIRCKHERVKWTEQFVQTQAPFEWFYPTVWRELPLYRYCQSENGEDQIVCATRTACPAHGEPHSWSATTT